MNRRRYERAPSAFIKNVPNSVNDFKPMVSARGLSKFNNVSPFNLSYLTLPISHHLTSAESERAMAARKELEVAWKQAGKIYATPEDASAADSTRENAPKLSYRRGTSPGGTVHEYYADGTEKKPDEFTSEPIKLGRRIILGYAHPARVAGLVSMHHLYGAESDRLNATFDVNNSDPEVEFINRAGLRAVAEE